MTSGENWSSGFREEKKTFKDFTTLYKYMYIAQNSDGHLKVYYVNHTLQILAVSLSSILKKMIF